MFLSCLTVSSFRKTCFRAAESVLRIQNTLEILVFIHLQGMNFLSRTVYMRIFQDGPKGGKVQIKIVSPKYFTHDFCTGPTY